RDAVAGAEETNEIPRPGARGPGSAVESARRGEPRCDVVRAARAISDDRGAQHPVVGIGSPGVHRQKKPYTPPNNGARMSRPPDDGGVRRSRSSSPTDSAFNT